MVFNALVALTVKLVIRIATALINCLAKVYQRLTGINRGSKLSINEYFQQIDPGQLTFACGYTHLTICPRYCYYLFWR